MVYVIDVENGADRGTITPDVGFRYNINLNTVNEAEIKISGSGASRRGLMTIGSTVYIYKDGTLVFKGLIDNTDYFVGGTVVFHASGWETWLGKENGAYANSPWTSTASATIFSAIIAESSYLGAGTINAGFSMDFRLTTGQSLWNSISNLAMKTSQDVSIDYTALPVEISVLDHVGSSSIVATLNEGIEITNLRKSEGYPRGNIIKVYGKGDGDDQITGTDSDAASIAAYGSITKSVIDRSVASSNEANRLATALLPLNKDPPKIYDFDLSNPGYSGLSLGDEIKLNALDQDVTNETVRIVGIEEGEIGGVSYKKLQVTNPELKTLMRTKNKILAKLRKDQQDDNSYMQGQRIVVPINGSEICDATNPLQLRIYVPSYVADEIGNNRIKSVKLDYSLKNYKKIVNSTEDVTLISAGTANRMTSTTAPTSSTVQSQTEDKANYYTQVTDFGEVEEANIDAHHHDLSSSTSGNYTLASNQGSDTSYDASVNTSSYDNISSEAISGTFDFIYVYVHIYEYSWSGSDEVGVRVRGPSYTMQEYKRDFNTGTEYKRVYVIPQMGSTTGTVYVDMISVGGHGYYVAMTVWGGGQIHSHSIPSQNGGASSGAENENVWFQKVGGASFNIDTSSQGQDNLVYDTDRVYSDRVTGVSDTSASTVSSASTGNRVTGTVLDLTEVVTTTTGITLFIDSVDRTAAVFGSTPHNDTEDQDINITDYCDTAGWHLIQIFPQGDKAFTIAEVRLDFVLDS